MRLLLGKGDPSGVVRLTVVLAASLMFLWPAVVNGGAFLFPDSVQYIRGPDGALGKILGPEAKSDWSIPRPAGTGAARIDSEADKALSNTPRAGRSIYYGLLANLGARTGGFWLTMILQAVAVGLSIDLLCRAMGWTRLTSRLAMIALAAVSTTLPLYADFVMPDVFAAVVVIVGAALIAGADRLSKADLGLAIGLMAYGAAVHTSHSAILAAMLGVAVLLWALAGPKTAAAKGPASLTLACVAALAIAGVAGAGFNLLVRKAYHAPPIEVPFLTARIVSPGHPGAQWLKDNCHAANFTVCGVSQRLPMGTNDFLWSIGPIERTAFNTAPLADQAAMGSEQWRLFLTVFRDRPGQAAVAFLRDWAEQLANFSLEGMNLDNDQKLYLDQLAPQSYETVFHASRAYLQGWAPTVFTRGLTLTTAASLAILALLAIQSRARRPEEDEPRLLAAALIVAVAILTNAAVCGGLSGVFGRYQARVLPPLILLGWFALALLVRKRRVEGAAARQGAPV